MQLQFCASVPAHDRPRLRELIEANHTVAWRTNVIATVQPGECPYVAAKPEVPGIYTEYYRVTFYRSADTEDFHWAVILRCPREGLRYPRGPKRRVPKLRER